MAHLNSKLLWQQYASPFYKEGMKVLEIGPAGSPTFYQQQLLSVIEASNYTTLDVRHDFISGAERSANFILATDPYNYPVADDSFDIVFSDMVIAHVPFFWDWYKELVRITKPGGYIITLCAQSYPSCPSPIDAWRISADGMQALNLYFGLQTVLCKTESLEAAHFNILNTTGARRPGASIKNTVEQAGTDNVLRANLFKNRWNRIASKIPKLRSVLLNPVQVAFDTISIAQKPTYT